MSDLVGMIQKGVIIALIAKSCSGPCQTSRVPGRFSSTQTLRFITLEDDLFYCIVVIV